MTFVPVPGRAVRRNPVAGHPPGWAPAPLRQHVIQAVSRWVDGTRQTGPGPGLGTPDRSRSGFGYRDPCPTPAERSPRVAWPLTGRDLRLGRLPQHLQSTDSPWNPWLWPYAGAHARCSPYLLAWPRALFVEEATAVLEQFIGPGMIDACTVLLKEAFCNRGPVLDFDAEVGKLLARPIPSGRGRSCRALSTKLRRCANKRTGRFGPTGTAQSGQPRCRIAVGSFLAPSPTW